MQPVLILTAWLLLAGGPALGTGHVSSDNRTQPYLQVYPDSVHAGGTVTAYGRGFCASNDCSQVTVSLDSRPVAKTAVASDGTFKASFAVALGPGRYTVLASQTLAGGAKSKAFSSVFVPILEGTSSGQFPPGTPVPGGTDAQRSSTGPVTPHATASGPTASASGATSGAVGQPSPTARGGGTGWLVAASLIGALIVAAGGWLWWHRRQASGSDT